MPDIGTKLLDPKASYVGTYRQLWDKLADPKFDVRGWQATYRWVNDSVQFAGARSPVSERGHLDGCRSVPYGTTA